MEILINYAKELEKSLNQLDKGQSVNSIAKQEDVRESAIGYGIQQGYLKKREVG